MSRARLVALAPVLAAGFLAAPPLPAASALAKPCKEAMEAGGPKKDLPPKLWPQETLNFVDAWRLTRGAGVKVAVIDSGVDANHPQLKGVKTYDVTKSGPQDCVGHGTEVAGIIGARDLRGQGVPFVGVAPGAEIISIKAATAGTQNDPKWAPTAIRKAVDVGAKVINISSQSPDYTALREAVKYAQQKDVLIIAAAGNIEDEKKTPAKAYPASYQGVIAVGSLNKDGTLATFSNKTTPVTVTAPGQAVVSTWPKGTYHSSDGTSQAAPFVAGTAALIRSYHPNLTAPEVKQRIEQTADGSQGQGTGSGVVNPLRAVTTVMNGKGGGAAPAPVAAGRQRVTLMRPPPEDTTGKIIALSIAGGTLTTAAAIAAGAVIIPAGRRRNWRSTP